MVYSRDARQESKLQRQLVQIRDMRQELGEKMECRLRQAERQRRAA